MQTLSEKSVRRLLEAAARCRVLVVGDAMLDQFIWGKVNRISPEAPVPVVEFHHESLMPGGAANVARNLTALGVPTELFAVVGDDLAGRQLREILSEDRVGVEGVIRAKDRMTTRKIRIIAHQQQVARVDRESRELLSTRVQRRLMKAVGERLADADAVIVGDYCKGVVDQEVLDELKTLCRERGIWLSLDPKPYHHLDLKGLSLITPNRKEAFDLAGMCDGSRGLNPMEDQDLLRAADRLFERYEPALFLITLGDQGMLLCRRGEKPFHIPTVAQEVFDVSGAGDTVISSFTLAIAAGASPVEAAILSNHASGVVVGKIGTATVTPSELLASFRPES